MGYKNVVECCRKRFEDSNTHLRFEMESERVLNFFLVVWIQPRKKTLSMNLKGESN